MNLNSPITTGSRALKMYAGRLEKLGIFTYHDLLLHLPTRYEDYSLVSKIGKVQLGETATIIGKIKEIKNQYLRGGKIKTIQKATIVDETGSMQVTWFNQPFLTKTLTTGISISVSGKIDLTRNGHVMNSPDYEIIFDDNTKPIHTGRLVPIYPETKGVSSKWIRRQIHNLLRETKNEIEDYLPNQTIIKHNLTDLKNALEEIHFPQDLVAAERAKRRLSFDELFLLHLAAAKRKQEWGRIKKAAPIYSNKKRKEIGKFISSLPFKLTSSQIRAIDDILRDLSQEKPMNRLLQGDVGSGKTIVSAVAMYAAFLNGFQSVLLSPTEILTQQHFNTIEKYLAPLGVNVKIVTGSNKLNEEFDILIGTHAILNEKIRFKNLALVVIDEQQRFGVNQRGAIREKGENPHLLTMTATPIPRTVALTMYGDLDLSYLNEIPQNRKRIKTWLVPPEKRNAAYEWIKKQIKDTESQVFVICPFIEESESMQTVKAAKAEYEKLKNEIFPDLKLGILHGKMKSKDKDETLTKFRKGDFDILVATPVVEVGIDISNATIIMIEASERFGLAQLHQLRGRVGRGEKQSYCLLFADNEIGQNSKRLKGMETLHSGAELAELDLKIRGPGNIYGILQHGITRLKAASFYDTDLIMLTKTEAELIFQQISKFPNLNKMVESISSEKVSPD